jgi:hypothetical protein
MIITRKIRKVGNSLMIPLPPETISESGFKGGMELAIGSRPGHIDLVPRTSHHISQRQKGQDPRVIDIAWRAQRRLYKRWQRLLGERRKRSTVVAVAVGRELAAFCWEIATLTG